MSDLTLNGAERLAEGRARLAAVRRRLGDLRRLHRGAGRALRGWIDANFAAEGGLLDDFPAGWPPLARSTLASRRRRGRGTRPLEDSGRLRRGITLTVDDRAAVLNDPVPYAARHQLGLGVPRRPFFPGAPQARRIIDPVIERFVREALP